MVRTASEPRRPRPWARLLGAGLLLGLALPVRALTVFACEPEWAALTRVLAPQAKLHVATHAGQDPHHIEARPSLIAQLRAADLAVCTGAGLESGWLPMLRQRAGREPLLFEASDYVALIDAQPGARATPWSGDVHAEGNPHIHTDPRRLLEVAQGLAEQLQALLPAAERPAVAQRLAAFQQDWRGRIAAWERQAAPLRGRAVAAQHSSFGYLFAWLGLRPVADLEPKPGMAPTPGHLQQLLERLRGQPPAAVVISSYQDPRPGRWLSGQLGGTPLLVLPATVAEDAAAPELAQWMDGLLQKLLAPAGR